MFDVRIKRVTEHPLETQPNTIYVVQNGGTDTVSPSVYLVVTGATNDVICRTLKPEDIRSALLDAVSTLTGMVKAVDGELMEAVPAEDFVDPKVITNFTAPQRPSVNPRVSPINNTVYWDLNKYQILRVYLDSDLNNLILSGLTLEKVGIHYQVIVLNQGGSIAWGSSFGWPDNIPGDTSGELNRFDAFNFVVETADNITAKLICVGSLKNTG